jgi:DNA-binding Lrp family transcriptional regulator
MRAYVLIEAKVGMAGDISKALRTTSLSQGRILSVEVATGPYDVIALLQADDLDRLGRAVSESIQVIEGVGRTTTCLVVKL